MIQNDQTTNPDKINAKGWLHCTTDTVDLKKSSQEIYDEVNGWGSIVTRNSKNSLQIVTGWIPWF